MSTTTLFCFGIALASSSSCGGSSCIREAVECAPPLAVTGESLLQTKRQNIIVQTLASEWLPAETTLADRKQALLALHTKVTSKVPSGYGLLAPLNAEGFLDVTSMCCPMEMERFFNRLLEALGYLRCSQPHVQGLMHWFACVPKMDFQYVIDVIEHGNPCKYWTARGQVCPTLSPECAGHWCNDGGSDPPATYAPVITERPTEQKEKAPIVKPTAPPTKAPTPAPATTTDTEAPTAAPATTTPTQETTAPPIKPFSEPTTEPPTAAFPPAPFFMPETSTEAPSVASTQAPLADNAWKLVLICHECDPVDAATAEKGPYESLQQCESLCDENGAKTFEWRDMLGPHTCRCFKLGKCHRFRDRSGCRAEVYSRVHDLEEAEGVLRYV